MSQEAFVEFYDEFLNTPEGADLRDRIDAVTDPEAFCAAAVEGGRASGFDFDVEDVRAVMKASEAAMARELAAASGELKEAELDQVVGGADLVSYDIPKVTIRNFDRFEGINSYNTIMCAW